MTNFAPGEVFLGKYRIEKVLGQGGMGVVVAARHMELDELVAIKFLHPMFAAQQDQVERFLREGRAAAKIKSEHVARVRDVGKADNGSPYMILEHLTGLDLGVLIKNEGKVGIPDAVEYVLQACEALAEAHTSGIVHRDLKPANLFLTERADGSPCVKLLDFGISKLLDNTDAALTATNGMMGSPLYMAPEQLAAAKNVDKRADIWALGVILYELVTAERPFMAETLPQLVLRVATDRPTPLSQHLPDAPVGFELTVMRCLEKSVDERFADVGALAKALEPFAPAEALPSIERITRVLAAAATGGSGRKTRTVRTQPQPDSSTHSPPLSQVESAATVASGNVTKLANTTNGGSVSISNAPAPTEQPKKRTGLFVALGGAGLAAIGLVVLLSRKPEPTPAVAAPPPPAAVTQEAKPAPTPTVTEAKPAPTPAPTPTPTVSEAPSAPPSSKYLGIKGPTNPIAPTAKTSASTKPSAKPNCDPPYVIDGEGNKKYKMECL